MRKLEMQRLETSFDYVFSCMIQLIPSGLELYDMRYMKFHAPGACSILDSRGQSIVTFAFMTSPSGQSGIHKPEQVFVLLHVASREEGCGDGQFSGLMLELSTSAYVPPSGSTYLPTQPEKFGALKMFTTDGFVDYLLNVPTLRDPACHAERVDVCLLRFEDFLPSVVKVIGVDDDMGVLVATHLGLHIDGEEVDDPLDDQQFDGPGPCPALDDLEEKNHDHSGGVDLLSLLESETPSPCRKKPRRKQKEKAQGNLDEEQESGKKFSLLDDPSLGAFLDPKDIEALREAENLCINIHDLADTLDNRAHHLSGANSDSEGEVVVGTDIAEDKPASASSAHRSSDAGSTGAFSQLWVVGAY